MAIDTDKFAEDLGKLVAKHLCDAGVLRHVTKEQVLYSEELMQLQDSTSVYSPFVFDTMWKELQKLCIEE